MTQSKKAILALADGTVFHGEAFGAEGERFGEVVFNTSMTGYQEIATDPSYAGQIVCLTYPQIGNYCVNAEDPEAGRPWIEGLVVRELSPVVSNYRSSADLDAYLRDSGSATAGWTSARSRPTTGSASTTTSGLPPRCRSRDASSTPARRRSSYGC